MLDFTQNNTELIVIFVVALSVIQEWDQWKTKYVAWHKGNRRWES